MRKIFPILVFLLLIIMACQSRDAQLTAKDLRKGREGIVLSFLEGMPENNVFEKSPITIGVRAQNKGASDSENGVLVINTESDYVKVAGTPVVDGDNSRFIKPYTVSLNLKGKKINEAPGPEGQDVFYEFGADIGEITLSKIQDSRISAIACYDYYSFADVSVCSASKSTRYNFFKPACKPEDLTLTDQGGPVAVTKIEVKSKYASGNNVKNWFKIHLRNKGRGRIIKHGTSDQVCSPSAIDDRKTFNEVHVYVEMSGVPLKCARDGWVTLADDRDSITCEGTNEDIGPYYAPLYIQLSYGYLETISKNIRIEKP
jgi:hypothetical protein